MRLPARSLFDPLIFPQIFKMELLWDLTPRLVDILGHLTEANKGQEDTGTQVIEASEFKYEVRSYLGFKKPAPPSNNQLTEASGGQRSVLTQVMKATYMKSEINQALRNLTLRNPTLRNQILRNHL